MESLIFSINAVGPIVLLAVVGYFLKRIGLIGSDLAKGGNKLVFKVFLPCLLFLNVYKQQLQKVFVSLATCKTVASLGVDCGKFVDQTIGWLES